MPSTESTNETESPPEDGETQRVRSTENSPLHDATPARDLTEKVNERFRPYLRISPPWTAYERAKTVLMSIFVLPLRLLFFFAMLGLLWVMAKLTLLGVSDVETYRYTPLPRWRRAVTMSFSPIARAALAVSFGVWHIDTTRVERTRKSQEAFVIVANHLGYLDIVVLLAKYRGSFLAKGSIARTRFVGAIATAIQCLFVDEARGGLTAQLIDRVKRTYACHRDHECEGCGTCLNSLIIFPEGTTTNGEGMVRFRTGVFNAGLPVKPIAIRFPHKHFNLSWETIRFKEHIWRSMTQLVNKVEIVELPTYEPSEEEKQDSRLYARNVQQELEKVLEVPVYDLNRKHKFIYHSYVLKKISAAEALEQADEATAGDSLLVHASDESC